MIILIIIININSIVNIINLAFFCICLQLCQDSEQFLPFDEVMGRGGGCWQGRQVSLGFRTEMSGCVLLCGSQRNKAGVSAGRQQASSAEKQRESCTSDVKEYQERHAKVVFFTFCGLYFGSSQGGLIANAVFKIHNIRIS